jgi:hypothetical protein
LLNFLVFALADLSRTNQHLADEVVRVETDLAQGLTRAAGNLTERFTDLSNVLKNDMAEVHAEQDKANTRITMLETYEGSSSVKISTLQSTTDVQGRKVGVWLTHRC